MIYEITFGIEKSVQIEDQNKEQKEEILTNNVEKKETFDFYDYNSNATIGNLKEFFLTTFGQKYKFCKCLLFVYKRVSQIIGQNKYYLLSDDDKKKLNEFGTTNIYLIKNNIQCECEYKMFQNYMNMSKFHIIEKIKNLNNRKKELEQSELEKKQIYNKLEEEKNSKEKKIEDLKKENELLIKAEEFKHFKSSKLENFYDIIIDINSIKSINNEGWKVKFNEKGLEKYKKHKEEELIIIGVIGNNNKGKSFILSKISKIKLLTGTTIQTEGLSIKYPELEGYKGRKIILLDSAGMQTPVLRKDNNMNNINNKIEDSINEKIDKDKDINENYVNSNDTNIDNNKEIEIDKGISNDEINKELRLINQKEIKQNKEFKENARDKIMTELFLENFIIKA